MKDTETRTSRWHAGVYLILFVLGVRCTVSPDPFPGWSGDPLVMEAPITGITPTFAVGLDLLTLLASAVVLAGCAHRGWRPRGWELVCYLAGAFAVAWYCLGPHAKLMNIVIGCQWLAAFGAAVACVQACREAAVRRVVVAGLVGVGVIVALKGGYQVFVEHPQVYRDFVRNRSQVLAAQGWTEGSPMALAYERRISQADATGWFGLSNVFSTVMAGATVLCAGMGVMGLIGAAGRVGRGVGLGLVTAAGLFGVGVWLSHSKGGMAAALLGLGLLAVLWVVGRARVRVEPRVAGVVAAVLPFAALVAVAVRGVIGERLSELSILFRWFYLQGAARIMAESPLIGVGPDGFKDAYLRLKPAVSPEDVSSPHSWFVDLTAMLGIGGLAWAVWVVVQVWRTGKWQSGQVAPWHNGEGKSTRDDVRALLVVFGLVTAAGALFEHRLATVDGTVLRALSLVAAVVVGGLVCAVIRGWDERRHRDEDVAMARVGVVAPVVAAVVAVVTHCQIEMTGTTAGAGLWVLLLVAGGAGAGLAAETARHGSSGTVRGRLGTWMMLASAVTPLLALPKLVSWERHVREATRLVAPVTEFQDRAAGLATGRGYRGDSVEKLARDLSATVGQGVPPTAAGITEGLSVVRSLATELSAREMLKARNAGPEDFPTARALSRLRMIMAMSAPTPALRREGIEGAEGVVRSNMDAAGETSTGWAWIGTLRRTAYTEGGEPGQARAAADAFAKAAALAPYEPMYRVEAARLEAALGNRAEAARWAREALALSENMRLDPLRQLSGAELEEVRGLAGGS